MLFAQARSMPTAPPVTKVVFELGRLIGILLMPAIHRQVSGFSTWSVIPVHREWAFSCAGNQRKSLSVSFDRRDKAIGLECYQRAFELLDNVFSCVADNEAWNASTPDCSHQEDINTLCFNKFRNGL